MKKTKLITGSIIASAVVLILSIFLISTIGYGTQTKKVENFKVFATSDIHSYFYQTKSVEMGNEIIEHGDSSKLSTILKERRGNDSIYVDAGDFSMGTLLQAGYPNHAYELRLLGQLGLDVGTFGNHEFDQGPKGLASMLNAAKASGQKLPELVQSNIIWSENSDLKKAFENYGVQKYIVKNVNGVKVGIFGLEGIDSLDCAPTNGQEWQNYIDAAKETVKELKDKCDFILCLSHSGSPDGNSGEDIDLVKQVPEINLCISGHTHAKFDVKQYGDSYVVATGCYLSYLDQFNMEKNEEGKWEMVNYESIPVAGDVAQDPQIVQALESYEKEINAEYLSKFAAGGTAEDVVCQNPYTFTNIHEATRNIIDEPEQNLIADSYKYAAAECGIKDVDVTINGIGTVRMAYPPGPITVTDVFSTCPLGVSEDGTTGHPLCAVYVEGRDLKLLAEVVMSLGPLKEGMKLSYNGLQITWNSNRMLMDKIIDIKLKKDDGTLEEIQDDKLYKVVSNLYSMNMLGSLNNLSKGLLKVVARDADGNPIEDYYSTAIKLSNGQDLKEWVALKDYLKSLGTIPAQYSEPQDRIVNTNEGGLAIFANPGPSTLIVIGLCVVLILVVVLIVRAIVKKKKNPKKQKK